MDHVMDRKSFGLAKRRLESCELLLQFKSLGMRVGRGVDFPLVSNCNSFLYWERPAFG